MLILVRHAAPAATPDSAPETWPLSSAGLEAAAELGGRIPSGATWHASTEPKAWMTAVAAGRLDAVAQDARFNEIRRPLEPWSDDFRARRRAYVEGVDHPAWEPRSAVAARFDAGVDVHLAASGGAPVAIASHGMAMTVWLVGRGLIDAGAAAGEFWDGLAFPDAREVDLGLGIVRALD